MRNCFRWMLRRETIGKRLSVLYLHHLLKWERKHDNQITITVAITIARGTVVQNVVEYISEHGYVIFLCVCVIQLKLQDHPEQQHLLERVSPDAVPGPTSPNACSAGAPSKACVDTGALFVEEPLTLY